MRADSPSGLPRLRGRPELQASIIAEKYMTYPVSEMIMTCGILGEREMPASGNHHFPTAFTFEKNKIGRLLGVADRIEASFFRNACGW